MPDMALYLIHVASQVHCWTYGTVQSDCWGTAVITLLSFSTLVSVVCLYVRVCVCVRASIAHCFQESLR
jgi:hypothetical protein